MEILPPTPKGLAAAARLLRAGGVVIYPTDTAYAVGGVYSSTAVVRRTLQIKGRTDRKFTVVAASVQQVLKHFRLSPLAQRLARRYWPGPLSIVVSPRYAVRVPAASIPQTLARLARSPLIATSANRSGAGECYHHRDVIRAFAGLPHQPDALIAAGRLPRRRPSTIVRTVRDQIVILRQGPVRVPTTV